MTLLLALRFLLIGVALLAGFVACATFVGCVSGLWQGESFQTTGDWVVFVVLPLTLFPFSAGLFYLARWIGSRERARRLAEMRAGGAVEFLCPQCQADTLVRGPEHSDWGWFRTRCVARCLTCGERCQVPRDLWRGLPLPELGAPYETVEDKLELMRRYPMTTGHGICATLGAAFGIPVTICLSVAWEAGWLLSGAAFLASVLVFWWLGYLLFPAPRRPGQRCVNCGFDLRACTEPRCPECGTPFDPSRVPIRLAKPPEGEGDG